MNKIWQFFVERFRFTMIIVVMIVLTGLIGIVSIPKESSPEVKVPYASVTAIYPGASPLDVESLVTDPLEDQILNVEDIKNLDSSSSEGFASIFIEFETSADIDDRVQAVQEAVNQVAPRLPDAVDTPTVTELNFSNEPVLILSMSTDLPHGVLVEKAELLESEILNVSGISEVRIIGDREKEVQVWIDPLKLETYQVSVLEIFSALQGLEDSFPIGSIEHSQSNYSLRFDGSIEVKDLENLIIRNNGSASVYLRDLAEVQIDLFDTDQRSRVALAGEEPKSAITLQVYKRTGGDIIKMIEEVQFKIDELEATELDQIDIVTVFDSAEDIADQLGELSLSGLQTVILVFVILFIALGFREAFIAGLSIPLTFLITFGAFMLTGQTINFLSLFSLILALGILVDTGVVITEGMHVRVMEGKSPKQVAFETVEEYQLPLITGTMTTVAAFLPMMFMSGILGEFVKHIPRTVVITLIASLFIGLALLPAIGSRILKVKSATKESRFMTWLKVRYKGTLRYLLGKKRRQSLLILSMILCFFASLVLPASGVLKLTLFPDEDFRIFYIDVELPKGTLVEETDALVQRVEAKLSQLPELSSYTTSFGSGASSDSLSVSSASRSHLASLTVNLKEDRERSSIEIIEELRSEFRNYSSGNVEVIGVSGGPPSGSPIEFRIFGSDFDELKRLSDQARVTLADVAGVVNVKSTLDDNINEFVFKLDRAKVQLAGANIPSISQAARIAVNGVVVNTIKSDGEEYDIRLQSRADESLNEILSLPIPTPTGTYPLSYFTELELVPAPSTISHKDGDRVVVVTADLEGGALASEALPAFQEEFQPDLRAGYRIVYGGEAEELQESLTSLGTAMMFGLFLILIILVLQFNSFKQSFLVLFTIPLALIGVFTGLAVLGLPLSFPAFIGVVALGGIVVNNAIILIDRINKNREDGYDKAEAVLRAGVERLQPILLTSVTTIAGILPLALSNPSWGPLGFAIISGLLFSTVLTLIVIPSAYMRMIR